VAEPGNAAAPRKGLRRSRRSRRRRTAGEQGHPPGILVVCSLVAGTQMTWGLVVPVLPVYADELGAGPGALGLVVAAFGLGRLIIDIPAGALAQRVDQTRMLLWAVVVVAVCTLASAVVDSVPALVSVRFLLGLAGGVAITTGQSLLTGSDPARLGRTMGALQAYQLAGGAVGPALGGALVGIDARLPFVAGALVLGVLVVVGLRLRHLPPVAAPVTTAIGPGSPPARLFTSGLVAVCLVGFTVFFVRFGGQQFLFPVLAYEEAGLSPAQLGGAIAATTVLGLLLVRSAGSLTDHWGRRPMVVASTTVLGLTTLGFLGAGNAPVFLGALVLSGIATAFTGPPTGAFLADSVPPGRRGVAVGVYRTCGDAATLLGPLLLGALAGAGASGAAVLLLAAAAFAAAGLFALLTRPRPDTAPPPAERDAEVQTTGARAAPAPPT